jgi:uncharacterized repeat protein (TIGR01451 family)
MARPWFDRWLNRKTSAPRRRRKRWLALEPLEERILLDSGLPAALVVGRTLSSYTTAGIQKNRETLTLTVYNEQADPVSGVLLTDTLQPGVTFQSASQLPDQSGQQLAWSLGTIQGFDRASVTLTVSLVNPLPLQLDAGAQAFATLNAGMVTNATPPATLRQGSVDASLLASTPDANTTDPFVQEAAAALKYDPQQIFDFLHNDVGYNSYTGSLRGARGTLWSSAGNALDVASLGVALMRASGIPAQYEAGMLSRSQAQQLILSMFPASFQTVGYIPAGTQTANPANDPQLLSETESHYWFQFDAGSGMKDADPLMDGATIGQTFTTSTGTFTEVADNLRQKTEVKLTAEIYTQISAAFGVGDGLSQTVVLDKTFNDVDLVGRPLTLGNFVTSTSTGFILTATTNTYTPYVELGDDAFPDTSKDEIITGTPYQEVLTNFPLGNQTLKGLFLQITLSGPQGASHTSEKSLADRIGYAARQGLAPVNVSVDPNAPALVTPFDVWSISVLPGLQDPTTALTSEGSQLQSAYTNLGNLVLANDPAAASALTRVLVGQTRAYLDSLLRISGIYTQGLATEAGVAAYLDRPRLTVVSAAVTANGSQGDILSFEADLLSDSIRAFAAPRQESSVVLPFQAARGVLENTVESNVFPQPSTPGIQLKAQISTSAVFDAAANQGIPLGRVW